jgi:hypothetical protein
MPQPDKLHEGDKPPQPPSVDRRPYHQPELIEYGSVAKLTQGTLSVGADAGPGMMMACL